MIHVCLSLYDKNGHYSKFTGVSIASILENTNSPVTVHLLHDSTLNQKNRDKFNRLVGNYENVMHRGGGIDFLNVEELCSDKINDLKNEMPYMMTGRFSLATFYRLFIPELLNDEVHKAIYLDSDIFVNLDIKELWDTDIEKNFLAASPEILQEQNPDQFMPPPCRDNVVQPKNYFNAGVLLLNLTKLRSIKNLAGEGAKILKEHPTYREYSDQEILNFMFAENAVHLPAKFNTQVRRERAKGNFHIERKIYHYLGGSMGEGLTLNTADVFNRLWFNVFVRTPWFDFDLLENIQTGVQNFLDNLQYRHLNAMTFLKIGKRAFFMTGSNFKELKNVLKVTGEEAFIDLALPNAFGNLVEFLNSNRGESLVFVLYQNYRVLKTLLEQRGFSEGRDFVDLKTYLPSSFGIKFDSVSLLGDL